jgi:hypothetical protein
MTNPFSKIVRHKTELEEFTCPAQFRVRMRWQGWSSTAG